jgi:hypothetical protein
MNMAVTQPSNVILSALAQYYKFFNETSIFVFKASRGFYYHALPALALPGISWGPMF